MAQGEDWSREEVEACVADYFAMLTLELNGQRYNKAEHRRALLHRLDGRSEGSVEFKHCNISAVLQDLGYPSIRGYKRRDNVQAMLFDIVEARLPHHPELEAAAEAAVTRPAAPVGIDAFDRVWIDPPKPQKVREPALVYAPTFSPARRDYLAKEARNRSLGRAGELFVVELEARRLHALGKKALADRVEHVAATQGDGLGFDILSFEDSGRERLIEVKTTAFDELTPFYVSRSELARSEIDADRYHLYRLFDFRERPRVFALSGRIEDRCEVQPVSFLARLAG